jgi:VWFA-related protein
MRFQSTALLTVVLLCGGLTAHSQDVSHTATPTVIRSETRLVLVDSVVTDKKGNYVSDLTQKNFKVYEDNKEMPITSFSFEADPASPNNNQKRYLVLFFDNASVSTGDQVQARAAAQKFVDSNTGPTKFIAVADFSGTLRIAQNFTNDPELLKSVINGVKMSAVSTRPGPSLGQATMGDAGSFGVRSVLMGLRSLAKGLSDVPGRKILVMLTAGFPLTNEARAELTATIDACNKSNVSVYPIDVRGLATGGPGMLPTPGLPGGRGIIHEEPPMARLAPAGPAQASSLLHLASFANSFAAPEQVSSGAGGAGGARGGSSGTTSGSTGGASSGTSGGTASGSRGGSTGTSTTTAPGSAGNRTGNTGTNTGTTPGRAGGTAPVNPSMTNPMNNARTIVPPFPQGADANMGALYMLAEGTGGFVIVNTNDLLGGMEKIAREQNQYYLIGFSPAESAEGSCHTLHVKVDHGGDSVRSRSGYCNVRQVDLLAGKPAETELESIAAGSASGTVVSPMQLPFFYTSPNVARVNLAMEIPSQSFKFEKVKGKLHSEMNLLGIAYRPDGSVGAKFSDVVKLDYENKAEVEAFQKKPLHYESQFDIVPGQYNFKMVFSAGGESFGKIEKPLVIEPFDGKQFAVSSLALATELQKTTDSDIGLDSVLVQDRVPLVALGFQAIPAAVYRFHATDTPSIYLEIFEPGLTDEKPPEVGVSLRIVDRKTNDQKIGGNLPLTAYVRKGNPLVPVILHLPVKDLTPGSYRVDVMGLDNAGKSVVRSADFEID